MTSIKKILILICILFCFAGCFERKLAEKKYSVIEIANNVGNYQKAYCSDYFSSLDFIPLETNYNSLIGETPVLLVKDSLIFICSILSKNILPLQQNIFVFNRSGKFLNQVGRIGQGPGEFIGVTGFFLDHEKPVIYINEGVSKIFEYEFNGKFIDCFLLPTVDGNSLFQSTYVEDNLFISAVPHSYGNKCKYFLFNREGNIVKAFPNNFFYYTDTKSSGFLLNDIDPFTIDKQLYLKDIVNDTLYTVENLELQPVCVFDLDKYSYPLGKINKEGQKEILPLDFADASKVMRTIKIVGTSRYFFYNVFIPSTLPKPKERPKAEPDDIFSSKHAGVLGIYDLSKNTNILLDTDMYQQKGIINDIDGGLPFFPRYYAGNGEVVDIWQAEDMKEMLTEGYFAKQTIKDKQAHQKLKELLKNLKDDDNPVVVVAKLK